jgi:hypothetical protein
LYFKIKTCRLPASAAITIVHHHHANLILPQNHIQPT